ncbi:MAG: hypothetical protein AAFX00_05015 [Pseudomonadota bacterium]
MYRRWQQAALVLAGLSILGGCIRDGEDALRDRMDQWFYVEKPIYFESRMRCTAALYLVEEIEARPALTVQSLPEAARMDFRRDGLAALRVEGRTPHELTDALLMSQDGALGKQALAAGALAGDCFKGTEVAGYLSDALQRPGAMMAYDSESDGLMVLDPDLARLFYLGGDVW